MTLCVRQVELKCVYQGLNCDSGAYRCLKDCMKKTVEPDCGKDQDGNFWVCQECNYFGPHKVCPICG